VNFLDGDSRSKVNLGARWGTSIGVGIGIRVGIPISVFGEVAGKNYED
jgi:hypothetical protein